MSKDFILKTTRKNIINITVSGLENLSSAPCLILVHGFKGFKDWGFWNFAKDFFAQKGFFVVSFNFSHNGIGNNSNEFTEPDKFAKNTFSLEISELSEIIDNYKSGFFGKTTNRKIGLIGHSRGGAISILVSSKNQLVSACAVWGSIAKPDRYTSRQKSEWRKNGFIEVLNTRTKQVMRLDTSLLEDIELNKKGSLNIENAVKSLKVPLLIVHGEQDLTVKKDEAMLIYSWADKSLTELELIPATGHTFNVTHPFNGPNNKFERVLNKTLKFFETNLIKE